jgi:hypothetical protein
LKCAVCEAEAKGIHKKESGLYQFWIALCGECYNSRGSRDLQIKERAEKLNPEVEKRLIELFAEKATLKRRAKSAQAKAASKSR